MRLLYNFLDFTHQLILCSVHSTGYGELSEVDHSFYIQRLSSVQGRF